MQISYSSVESVVTRIVSRYTGITSSKVLENNNLQALGLDQLDLFNLILAVEKIYKITIPDEVPLETITDLAHYVYEHKAA